MKHLFFASILIGLVSCTANDDLVDVVTTTQEVDTAAAISFGFDIQKTTRADIAGAEAADLLGGHFYVTGTKGTEATTSPSPTLVFDNYLTLYTVNTAGTTLSNTANWEYVGVIPGTAPAADHVKLSALNSQTIKYWDYSVDQYDFLAFSTGKYKSVNGTSGATDEIGVTAMKYGTDLAGSATAYTFDIPSVDALRNTYITDITEVLKANYNKEVTLKFKNLSSKIRIALYETIPGYAVKDVQFYQEDGTSDFSGTKSDNATLISAVGLPIKGSVAVYYPYIGTSNHGAEAYNKAAATVTPAASEGTEPYQTYGTLFNFATSKEGFEADGDYLGRTTTTATFAGNKAAMYYTTVFPVSSSNALTLRVDYTLVSTDGSGEEIHVYGAKAVVPATYTKWMPNYAYTYIFKISDNTNGWTDQAATAAGLFPITFDAVVTEATDVNAEQTTITTVATPSITTYQQNHDNSTNEYSCTSGKDLYVQVMDNSTVPASLVTTLSNTNSLLYAVSDGSATEAKVMDALEKRTTDIAAANVTGRNGIILTKDANISNNVTSIVNGVDDNPIKVNAGEAAEITISNLASGTYAYVYDYTPSSPKTTVTEYEPIAVSTGSAIGVSGQTHYASITTDALDAVTAVTSAGEAVNTDYIYFSKTTNGTSTTTYSYMSVAGKTTLPAGLIKVEKASASLVKNVNGATTAVAGTIYFDTYITNNGKYGVKVIKIISGSSSSTKSNADRQDYGVEQEGTWD
jgi:hypothetical protein